VKPTQALAFLAVFVYATHATQAIAFEWKPGCTTEKHATHQAECIAEHYSAGFVQGQITNVAV